MLPALFQLPFDAFNLARKNIQSLDYIVALAALAIGWLIGYAHLYLFPSELNPNLVTQPSLIDQGFVLYQHLGDQKPPLLLLTIAWLLPVFQGDAVTAARTLHFFLILLVVFVSITWVYRKSGLWAACCSSLFMLAWSPFLGLWATAYYDLVVSLFFLLFFFLMSREPAGKDYLKSIAGGFLVGVAALIKQQALILALIFVADLATGVLHEQLRLKRSLVSLAIFLGCLLVPISVYLVISEYRYGSLGDIVFWNFLLLFQNNFASLGALPVPPAQMLRFLQVIILLVPFTATFLVPGLSNRVSRSTRIWLLVFLAAAVMFQYPRFSGRHWSVVFPFAALISGLACADLVHMIRRRGIYLAAALFLLAPAWWAYRAADQYLSALLRPNPAIAEYGDLVPLASMLDDKLPDSSSLAIFPTDEANANLHYLLGRAPPHFFIYHYPWFMNHPGIKERWIRALDSEQTEVLLNFPHTWDVELHAPEIITFIGKHYQLVETVEWNGRPVQIMLRKPADFARQLK